MVSNKHLHMVSAQQAYIFIYSSIYLCFIIPSQFLHSEDWFPKCIKSDREIYANNTLQGRKSGLTREERVVDYWYPRISFSQYTSTRFQKNDKSLTPLVKRCLWLLNRVYILKILISYYVQKDRYVITCNPRPDLINRLEIRIRPCDIKKPAGGYILVEGIEATARIQSWDKVGFFTILS